MDLLDFARGPALHWSVAIFILGILWRLLGVFLLRRKKDLSEAREPAELKGAVEGLFVHMWPYKPFRPKVVMSYALGYIFHIGLFIVLFFFVPHILFFKDILGFGWPGLPNTIIYFVAGISIAALVALLIKRITNPVTRLISNWDDYFSWFVTTMPFVTGMMATAHMGPRYETMLAIHILSISLLLIWFPFSKLMHTFFFVVSRATTGARFARRGSLA